MHASSLWLMEHLLGKLPPRDGGRVLDCGSAIADSGLQTSYRELCQAKNFTYTGFDLKPGRNVDAVGDIYTLSAFAYAKAFDLVISGQLLEHLTFPLLAVQRMKQAVGVGGHIILIAPWQYGEHRHPIDCWRVLPDGMRFLLEGFTDIDTGTCKNDCWGMACRPEGYKAPWKISQS